MELPLSEEQKLAISLNDKNLRIIACAGSGKTTTISKKVAHLLDPASGLNLGPENIIAFTYTEKAAAELKSKILEEASETRGLANMYVGTIHGWCLKALQENEFEYQSYSVLDEIKLKLFVDKNYTNVGMSQITKLSDPKSKMRRFIDTSLFIRIMDILRESELSHGAQLPSHLVEAREKYEATLKSKKLFDFSMIMSKAFESLDKDTNLNRRIKNNLKYLIVDEYQDVNPLQYQLIKKLQQISQCKVVVVGDDDQNIYQWRGSNNKYIIDFHKEYKPTEIENIPLNINYRSSEGITRLAENLISHNKDRIQNKRMSSANFQTFVKGEDILYNEYASVEEENAAISKYIDDAIGVAFTDKGTTRGLAYSDVCILLRTWSKAESIVEELDKREIPYVTAGVNQLFNTPEVEAAMGIFNYLYDEIAAEDLRNLWLDIPHQKIDIKKLEQAISDLQKHLPAHYTKEERVNKKTADGEDIKENWEYPLQDILWDFINTAEIYEDSFVDTSSKKKEQYTRERSEILFFNLGKFSQVINDFEEVNFNSGPPAYHLFSFLSFVTYVARDYYPEGWMNNAYKTPNAVQIMTVHQAKGLEFPVVIIPGLNKNYLPSKKRGGLNEWHFLDRSLIKEQVRYEGDDDKEDERRLLYVAITRSQKYLLLSRAPDLNNRLYKEESPFIKDLQKANVLVSDTTFDFGNSETANSEPKVQTRNITLDFTTLKDYFDCPYRFKLITMYGFKFPLNQRMGLGKSFHNCLMEIHKKAVAGAKLDQREVNEIIERQTHFPYISSKKLKESLPKKIKTSVVEYVEENKNSFGDIVFVEQDIQYKLDDNILVIGRIDLIKKRRDNGKFETTIIEFKSDEEQTQSRLTKDQLKLYALGHRELTGEKADYIMTYVIGENLPKTPEKLKETDLAEIEAKIRDAVGGIRDEQFKKAETKDKCEGCYQNRLCVNRRLHNVKVRK